MATPARWSIEHHVRADEPSAFVPVAAMPTAAIGDRVELTWPETGTTRGGSVADRVSDDTRGDFFLVTLDGG